MPRRKVEIDRTEFQKQITDIEKRHKFESRSALFQAISKTAWGKGISVSVLYSRATAWDLKIKTPKGAKGMRPGGSIGRTSRAQKISGDPDMQESVEAVLANFEEMRGTKRESLLHKFERGSMTAAIGLKCIDCCGGQQEEVKRCDIKDCPLYNFRPWKASSVDDVETAAA